MQRISISPRTDWQKKLEEIGFGFHTINGTYWNESAYYLLSEREVLNLETATQELYEMCLTAVQYVIDNKMYHLFGIPEHVVPVILKSWNDDAPAIYGRFDFGYKDGQIKMFEFNGSGLKILPLRKISLTASMKSLLITGCFYRTTFPTKTSISPA
jgi:glutathionylspermidine synthase